MKTYHKNPRQITDTQLDSLTEWLDELGDLSGIVHDLNTDQTITGNQRCKAIDVNECEIVLTQELDEPDRQGTVALGHVVWNEARYNYRAVRWTEEQNAKANVVANKAGGSWDFEILGAEFELEDLKEWGFSELELEMEGLTVESKEPPEDPGAQVDKAEELREKYGVELGQLWRLGEHRVVCGDCTDADVVERVMDGKRAEMCFTSPPYADLRKYSDGMDVSVEKIVSFIPQISSVAAYLVINLGLKRHKSEIVPYWDKYIQAARDCGLKLLSWNVWDKMRGTSVSTQTAMFAIEHEWLFVFGKKPKDLNRTVAKSDDSNKRLKYAKRDTGGRLVRSVRQQDGSFKDSPIGENFKHKNLPTVVQCYPQMARDITTAHSAPFPVDLPAMYIEAMTKSNDIISDPFLGSGTTLIACERLNRQCRGIEIEPKYIAVTLERWHQMTGLEPQLINPHFLTED